MIRSDALHVFYLNLLKSFGVHAPGKWRDLTTYLFTPQPAGEGEQRPAQTPTKLHIRLIASKIVPVLLAPVVYVIVQTLYRENLYGMGLDISKLSLLRKILRFCVNILQSKTPST